MGYIKQIFVIFLSLGLLLSAQSVRLAATAEGDFQYALKDDGTIEITKYTGNGNHVIIPAMFDGKPVTQIGDSAFEDCWWILSVTIPDSVTVIGSGAFWKCTMLNSVTIPSGVTELGPNAFHCCWALDAVTIPDGVTEIKRGTFQHCTSLTAVKIPENVTVISRTAFAECTSLADFLVADDNANYASVDGVLFNKDKSILIQYPMGRSATGYTIPDSVTEIADWAFADCTMLISITIPDNVIMIRRYAFDGCGSFTIYGKDGSYAQQFATNDNIPFAIGTAPHVIVSDKVRVEGALDPDVALLVEDVEVGNALSALGGDYTAATSLDITLQRDGKEVQLDGIVKVYLDVPEEYTGENCHVFRVESGGNPVDMNAKYVDGTLVFPIEYFGRFVVATTDSVPTADVLGDVNRDGFPDTGDALLVLQYSAKLIDEYALDVTAADVNGDGKVDTGDALLLLQFAAKLIDSFPASV